MLNNANRVKRRFALTLIEVMLAVLIIVMGIVGAASFRYYCVLDAKKADVQANAARMATMLLENWKAMEQWNGTGGAATYNPLTQFNISGFNSQFTIETASGPASPTGFTPLANSYQIKDQANNVYYYVTLSYNTITLNSSTNVKIKALNTIIAWRPQYDSGSVTSSDRYISMTTYQD
jgi:Tfp pilus assembly protein PilV